MKQEIINKKIGRLLNEIKIINKIKSLDTKQRIKDEKAILKKLIQVKKLTNRFLLKLIVIFNIFLSKQVLKLLKKKLEHKK